MELCLAVPREFSREINLLVKCLRRNSSRRMKMGKNAAKAGWANGQLSWFKDKLHYYLHVKLCHPCARLAIWPGGQKAHWCVPADSNFLLHSLPSLTVSYNSSSIYTLTYRHLTYHFCRHFRRKIASRELNIRKANGTERRLSKRFFLFTRVGIFYTYSILKLLQTKLYVLKLS